MTDTVGTDAELLAQLRSEVASIARRVFERGLVSGTGGNISVRVPGTTRVLITRTGAPLGDLGPADVLEIGLSGQVVEAASGCRPSMETPIHLSAYRLRPDISAVIHLHPPYSVALSLRGQPLPMVTISARLLLGHVPCIPIAYPNTPRLHDAMERAFRRFPGLKVVLMAAHGITAYGSDLQDAFNLADLCEATAQQAYLAAGLGIDFRLPEPEDLTDD